MRFLMLAVIRARLAAVAWARIWSSASPTRPGSATAASTSCSLARSCSAMTPENISSSSKAPISPRKQLAFPPPGVFGRVVGGLGRSDLGIDLIGIGGPVPDGDADQPYWDASVLRYQGEQVVFGQVRLMCTG